MSKKLYIPIPIQRALRILGSNINNARRRRRITMELMSERAGFSRITLAKIEKGCPGVSFGAYASALFVLGMLDQVSKLAEPRFDVVGLDLEEERLPKRIRVPRSKKPTNDK